MWYENTDWKEHHVIELKDIEEARQRISNSIIRTPLVRDQLITQANVFLKLDNLQTTGSFKERGAVNKLKKIKEEGKYTGVIGASAGNHAQAVAYHGAKLGFSVSMIMPTHTPTVKANATQKWGANIELQGETVDQGIIVAKQISKEKNLAFIHAFDDLDIIAGQGTAGLEILDDVPEIDCVVIPVGGGGMASGMATAIKSIRPSCKIIGVQTEKYPQVTNAFYGKNADKIVDSGPTIADGIAVKGIGEHTIGHLKKYVDEMINVSEEEIADAILYLLQHKKILAEGAGAAGLAAIMSGKANIKGCKNVATTICGGNIDMNLLNRIVEHGFLKQKRLLKVNVVISDRPGSLNMLTGLLKNLNVNILQIEHDRASTSIPYYNTGTNLLLETRGEQHYNETVETLKKNCFRVTVSN
ncbi:MAG: threonine ammonia-lyase [Bdellovibrionota bacterium]